MPVGAEDDLIAASRERLNPANGVRRPAPPFISTPCFHKRKRRLLKTAFHDDDKAVMSL
jgi:hypothetical protein